MAVPLRCPICRKEVALGADEFPFCSERCRLLDLGNWASEKYVISTHAPISEQDHEDDSEGTDR